MSTTRQGFAMRTELYWIDGPWPGRLAVAPRPRGGDWLADEIAGWRRAGIDVVVSLLTADEETTLDLEGEAGTTTAGGVEWYSFPITDRDVPASAGAFGRLVQELAGRLTAGKNVAVHCRQGIGRAALLAACLLVHAGADPAAAVRIVGAARGRPVPETPDQRRWIDTFAAAPAANMTA